MAADFSRMKTNSESDEMFFTYVDQYMGTYVRASVIQETSDSRFRVVEIGDPSGIPVVCIHHLGLINFSEHEIAEIRRKGIRLICPLRHGAIGPLDERLSTDEQFQHAIAGIDLAASLIPDKKVTIIGMLSGCIYAAHYLKHHPAKVRNLVLFGAPYKPSTGRKSTSSFKSQLHALATDDQKMLDTTVSFLLDRVDQPEQLKEVMKESHKSL